MHNSVFEKLKNWCSVIKRFKGLRTSLSIFEKKYKIAFYFLHNFIVFSIKYKSQPNAIKANLLHDFTQLEFFLFDNLQFIQIIVLGKLLKKIDKKNRTFSTTSSIQAKCNTN